MPTSVGIRLFEEHKMIAASKIDFKNLTSCFKSLDPNITDNVSKLDYKAASYMFRKLFHKDIYTLLTCSDCFEISNPRLAVATVSLFDDFTPLDYYYYVTGTFVNWAYVVRTVLSQDFANGHPVRDYLVLNAVFSNYYKLFVSIDSRLFKGVKVKKEGGNIWLSM